MEQREFRMSAARFLDHVKEGCGAGRRYCFLLGAGASVNSRIKSSKELMREWRQYLLNREKKEPGYIRECARDSGIAEERYLPLFAQGYQVRGEDFFTFYDLRFAGRQAQAYTYLQKLMEKAEPSFGYYALAVLLENTENKLVVTPNFDSLTEDSLFLYHAQRPLVVGHESLASFIHGPESIGHPVVAKIHRDLYFHALNREDGQREMDERWEAELRAAFAQYTPIVIGYAGGDSRLMRLLGEEQIGTVYWCTRHEREREHIETLLRGKPNGYLVRIQGFDEILFELVGRLMEGTDYDPPGKRMRAFVKQRSDSYEQQYQKLSKAVADAALAGEEAAGAIPDSALHTLQNMAAPEAGAESEGDRARRLWIEAMLAFNSSKPKAALKKIGEAVRLEPDNARYRMYRAVVYDKLGRHSEAWEDKTAAIALDERNAEYYDSRAKTLDAMGEAQKAADDRETAKRLRKEEKRRKKL